MPLVLAIWILCTVWVKKNTRV